MPFAALPFLLLIIPILEIAVFIIVGSRIGVLATLAGIVLTAAIGSVLLRVQGFSILSRIQREVDQGRIPGRELGDGVMILVAGVLLLTPGFVTDAIGFALFVPAIRTLLWRALAARIVVTMASGDGRKWEGGFQEEGVVDLDPGEFKETGDDNRDSDDPDMPSGGDSPWRGNGPLQRR